MISVISRFLNPTKGILCAAVVFITAWGSLSSQEQWADFVIEKDSSIMSVSLDLRFYVQKPSYKNLVIVGTQFEPCLGNGFPAPDSLDELYSFSDSTSAVINRLTKNELVAILTYKCLAFDVYYVKDTTELRNGLEPMIEKTFDKTDAYLTIKRDKDWDYYFTYLLPAGLTEDFLMDQKYLYNLALQGDDLQGLRKVSHWIYFNKLKQRVKMSERLETLKFSIDSIKYDRERKWPYELQVSRMDSITPGSIYDLTIMMKILSAAYLGQYDGWGTDLVRKENKRD